MIGGEELGVESGGATSRSEEAMDAEELRRMLRSSGVDLWALLETAVAVAAADHAEELRARRDGIVERLYAPPAPLQKEEKGSSSPVMKTVHREEDEEDVEVNVEKRNVLAIKKSLEDADQRSEDSLVGLLQDLLDTDITFKALKETDIGRHVNVLRKHSSDEVRGLAKQVVRKWKDLVDGWVKSNSAGDSTASPAILADGDSPSQHLGKNHQNGHQTPERGSSPHSHYDYSSSERNTSETMEPKAKVNPPRKEAPPTKPNGSATPSVMCFAAFLRVSAFYESFIFFPPVYRYQTSQKLLDPEKLASARRRLHENYREAQNGISSLSTPPKASLPMIKSCLRRTFANVVLVLLRFVMGGSQKATDDSGDGYPRDPKTEEFLRAQRRLPGEALLFKNGAIRKGGLMALMALTMHDGTSGHGVASRYLSHEPLSYSEDSYTKCIPPLFHPLPGLKLPICLPDSAERNPTKVTTLPNGLRVASEDALGPAACVGIFVDSGSIYETEESTGVTHLLERLAFKSTKHRSHLQIIHEVESIGGNVGASASREQMGYSYDTLKAYLPAAAELLIDCVRNPVFLESEVQEQINRIKWEIGDITKDPQQFLLDSLHLAGYSGALGKPLMAPESALERINGSKIGKFHQENYTADRMVLAAFGVDHEHLLAIAEPLLYDLERGIAMEVPKSTYTGGDFRHKIYSEKTHVALAFEVPGGWRHEKDATALTVLQTLMGGGGSFSAGGPGKGMHSRLYLRVLNKYQEVQSFLAFSSICNETGLFGVHLITGSDFVAKAVDVAVNELHAIATPGQVTELELHRAKNATRLAILLNLESRAIVAEDIGRQILTYGCRKPVDYFLRCLDELTLDDLTILAQKMLSSPLTMASWGDVDRVPSYASVAQRFQASI
ncbi:Insulinase (Peptidase family M16) [Musa troglodytarum]|uniref:Alpha-MPP n=1 Tax=Musa troglodytarum TaxID=320322 RepID=A0A9E7KNM6_9LILI|nr:Insulinase (Peptidase family M16) [Musa troglodytarum]